STPRWSSPRTRCATSTASTRSTPSSRARCARPRSRSARARAGTSRWCRGSRTAIAWPCPSRARSCATGRAWNPSDDARGQARQAMTLAELCVKRGVFAVMLIAFLAVLGLFSFRELGVDLFPRADPATVNINLKLPGATPEEITTQVVLPLEEALSTISGMDELSAQGQAGGARINCQFVLEREIEGAAQDVREKVAETMRDLPPNMLPPIIQNADPHSDPLLSVVVAGNRNLRETTEIADKRIKRVLETVDGVGEVSLTGARLRQIRIFADADKLAAYGLTIIDVQQAVQKENVEVPGGTIVRGDAELGVRTLGRLAAVGQFGESIVRNVG